MRRRIDRVILLVALLALLSTGNTTAREEDGSDSAEPEGGYSALLNQRLSSIESLHAKFRQSTSARDRQLAREQTGELWVAKPDRFRVVTEPPWAQELVSDGESFWSFDADLEQVIVSELGRDIREVPILLLGGEAAAITREYRIDYYQDEAREHFVLEPKEPNSLFAGLTIAFSGDVPVLLSIRDNLGQQTRIELLEPEINTDVDSDLFEFVPPEGVDVIDER